MTRWTTALALFLVGSTLACQPPRPHPPSTETLTIAATDALTEPVTRSAPPDLASYDNAPFSARPQGNLACTKDIGCPAARALPTCPDDWRPVPMAKVIEQRNQLVGKEVTVIGPLNYGAMCTERGCPQDVCCNGCSGQVNLGTITTRGYKGLIIRNDALGNLLSCGGDDSMVCCALKAEGQPVVVTGTLVRTESAPADYALDDAFLCTP